VFGANGQWRTRKERDVFAAAGIDDYTVWLQQPDHDGMRRELDELARELFSGTSELKSPGSLRRE
jgi:hypothetical protein